MPLETYLNELTDVRAPLANARLSELSALSRDEEAVLRARWGMIAPERRLSMVQQLSGLAEKDVTLDFAAVLKVALEDDDPGVRIAAIRGLWEYEQPDLVPRLIERLEMDEEPGVRAAAATALGQFAVHAEFDRLRPDDVTALDRALEGAVKDRSQPLEVRAQAMAAVGARSMPWVAELIRETYAAGNSRLRLAAIQAMGRNCESEWLPSLIECLSDDDEEVRYEAALASGNIGEDDATPYLLPLIEDEDEEVRVAAIAALGAISALSGSSSAREALESRTKDKNTAIREAVRLALEEVQFMEDPLAFPKSPDGQEEDMALDEVQLIDDLLAFPRSPDDQEEDI